MANQPPQIGGSLRDTIHSLAFGMIVSVLFVNFSKIFLNNYFVYICGTVFSIEFLLFSLYKPNTAEIEVYREPGRRGKLRVESGSDEFEGTTSAQPSPTKKNPAGKKKDKQSKKTEKDKDKHFVTAQGTGGEKKRESMTVSTTTTVEATSEENPPSSPTSPNAEKTNTWKRKFGHKWDAYKEKREGKKADKEKDKEADKDNETAENGSPENEETNKEVNELEEKDVNEPKDEKIEEVAMLKDADEEENTQDNREKEEGVENKDDPFEEDFGDDDEDKKEKPKMKLKWPKKRPKSTSSMSCFNAPKDRKTKSRSMEDENLDLPDG